MIRQKVRSVAIVMVIAAVSVLTACGIGDSPEKAAREWFEALKNQDETKLMERTCVERRDSVQEEGIGGLTWLGIIMEEASLLEQEDIKIDVSDVRFDVVDSAEDRARVQITAQVNITALGFTYAEEIQDVWLMVKEGGQWKWCGP